MYLSICFLVECLNLSLELPIHLNGVHRVHLGIRLRQDFDLRFPTFFNYVLEIETSIVVGSITTLQLSSIGPAPVRSTLGISGIAGIAGTS